MNKGTVSHIQQTKQSTQKKKRYIQYYHNKPKHPCYRPPHHVYSFNMMEEVILILILRTHINRIPMKVFRVVPFGLETTVVTRVEFRNMDGLMGLDQHTNSPRRQELKYGQSQTSAPKSTSSASLAMVNILSIDLQYNIIADKERWDWNQMTHGWPTG